MYTRFHELHPGLLQNRFPPDAPHINVNQSHIPRRPREHERAFLRLWAILVAHDSAETFCAGVQHLPRRVIQRCQDEIGRQNKPRCV